MDGTSSISSHDLESLDSKITDTDTNYEATALHEDNQIIQKNVLHSTDTIRSEQSYSSNIAKTFRSIRDSVIDDNLQTEQKAKVVASVKHDSGDYEVDDEQKLAKILSRNFELEDALRLAATEQEVDSDKGGKSVHDALPLDLEKSDVLPGTHDLNSRSNSVAEKKSFFSQVGKEAADPKEIEEQEQQEEQEEEEEEEEEISEAQQEETLKKVFTNLTTHTVDLPPDGGRDAYVSVFAATTIFFCTWGANAANGIILAYFLNANTFPGGTKFKYAIVTGLCPAIGQFLSPIVAVAGKVFGFKPTMAFGVVCSFLGFILAAFATELWQLFCTLGLLCGVGMSFTYVPATAVVPGWFLKKRSLAMGVCLLGTGLGGVFFSLTCNKLIEEYNTQKWALVQLAVVCTMLSTIAVIFIKQHNPPKPTGIKDWKLVSKQFGAIFKLDVIKKYITNLIAFWFSLAVLGYFIMVFSLSSYARARGLSANSASYLTVYLNVGQSIGRPLIGLSGDRVGRSNISFLLTFIICIVIFGFWIPAHTETQLIVFSIVMGLTVGVGNVMNTVLIADALGYHNFLPSWSYINIVGSPLFLFSEAIVQALTIPSASNPYKHAQIFAGCCFVAALMLSLLIREFKIKKIVKSRLNETLVLLEKYQAYEQEQLDQGDDGDDDNNSNRDTGSDDLTVRTFRGNNMAEKNIDPIGNLPDKETLLQRKNKYEFLLVPSLKSFIFRALYPIKA